MRWVLVAVGLMVLAVAVAAGVGATLPVKHHATRHAHFRQTPAAIYAVVAGPPDWRTDVKGWGALPEADGRKRWWERDAHGSKIDYELVEASPARRVTQITDRDLPFGGTWTVEINPASSGESDVRVTEDGEIYNVIFRFLSRFIFGYTGSIESYLRDLGVKFSERPKIEA